MEFGRYNFHRIATAYDTAEDTPVGLPQVQQTVTFAPIRARHFRLLLPTPPRLQVTPALASLLPPEPAEHQVTEFVLSPTPRVDHLELKAGYFLDAGLKAYPTHHAAATDVISSSRIVDLTGQLRPDGTLDWTPPAGRWAICELDIPCWASRITPHHPKVLAWKSTS